MAKCALVALGVLMLANAALAAPPEAGEAGEVDLFGLPEFTADNTFSGRASAVDGDTLTVGRRTVHLFGVEAPVLDAVCALPNGGRVWCGRTARSKLGERVRGVTVFCLPWPEDTEGEVSAFCRVSSLGGPLINRTMVEDGFAFAVPPRFRERSWPRLVEAGKVLEEHGAGVYSYNIDPPWSGAQPGLGAGPRKPGDLGLPIDPMTGG